MKEMFQSCNDLEYLDLSNFNVSNVKDKESIFYGCNKLKEIKGSEKFIIPQKNTKKETTSTLTLDKNSSYSYHYEPYNYKPYQTEEKSIDSYQYNSENYAHHHCKNCDKSIDSKDYDSYDGTCKDCQWPDCD